MADEGNGNEASPPETMTINVKTPKEQHQVEVQKDGLVKDVSQCQNLWT